MFVVLEISLRKVVHILYSRAYPYGLVIATLLIIIGF